METLSEHYMDNVAWFNDTLGVGRSCDMVSRDLRIGGRRLHLPGEPCARRLNFL